MPGEVNYLSESHLRMEPTGGQELQKAREALQVKEKMEKKLIPIICLSGICSAAYGMAEKNQPLFLVGLFFIVSGYLLIRRRLKASDQDKL